MSKDLYMERPDFPCGDWKKTEKKRLNIEKSRLGSISALSTGSDRPCTGHDVWCVAAPIQMFLPQYTQELSPVVPLSVRLQSPYTLKEIVN